MVEAEDLKDVVDEDDASAEDGDEASGRSSQAEATTTTDSQLLQLLPWKLQSDLRTPDSKVLLKISALTCPSF